MSSVITDIKEILHLQLWLFTTGINAPLSSHELRQLVLSIRTQPKHENNWRVIQSNNQVPSRPQIYHSVETLR